MLTLSIEILPQTEGISTMLETIEGLEGIHYVKILAENKIASLCITEMRIIMINIAVLGYGTIGSGVVEVLKTTGEHQEESRRQN